MCVLLPKKELVGLFVPLRKKRKGAAVMTDRYQQ